MWFLKLKALAGGLLTGCFIAISVVGACAQQTGIWATGAYSFSDELGGFRILAVSGNGQFEDPFVVFQEILSSEGSTMIVRHLNPVELNNAKNKVEDNSLYVRFVTVNQSNVPWVGYGLELQEQKDKPSTYGDGLSFDQISRETSFIRSDRFLEFERQYEPGDRVVYKKGVVNHRTQVVFDFIITDFTPTVQFFIYQDPLIPAS